MSQSNLYREIPSITEILKTKIIKEKIQIYSHEYIVNKINIVLDRYRKDISSGKLSIIIFDSLINDIVEEIHNITAQSLKRVINATGVVLHTNLGRAPISPLITEQLVEISSRYSTLEYDIETGERGSRYSHVERLLKSLTGAESCSIVNNNAAAVILVLNALCAGKKMIISRGELVEIGGSFRIPEVMEQAGVELVEVGATNKTHTEDYEKNIDDDTAALMKVHTSNYKIVGFTDSVSTKNIVKIAKKNNIISIEDLGSGTILDLSEFGFPYEPTVKSVIDSGIDIVTFSGDKLLGASQAGIIVGKKKYIDIIKSHPLNRALRVDKLTLSVLENTLKIYLTKKDVIKNIPILSMLTATNQELKEKATKLYDKLINLNIKDLYIEKTTDKSKVGGGAFPGIEMHTHVIKIKSSKYTIDELSIMLRQNKIPIITRVKKDMIYLDVRTIFEDDFQVILEGFENILLNAKN